MDYALDQPIYALNGEPVKDQVTGVELFGHEVLATLISNDPTPRADSRKWYHWSKRLWENGTINLDPTDLDKVRDYIQQLPNLSLIIRGALLDMLTEKFQSSLNEPANKS